MIDSKNIILEEWIKYFDFTATGLAYKSVEDEIKKVLLTYANTHSEVWYNALKTTQYYDQARLSLKKSLNITDDFFILPCWTWATAAIKKFQELMWIYLSPCTGKRLKIDKLEIDLPLVIIWPFEHHSNELSYREWLCDVIRIPLTSTWVIDMMYLENILEENKTREIIWSFSVASNVTWIINPVEDIYKLFKKYNWIIAFDSAAASPYMNVNPKFYDALFLSPHKLIWWPGSCWLLVIKKSICNQLEKPTFSWWWTVDYVSRTSHSYVDDFEIKEDAWTPWILQFIRASLAYELRNSYWLEKIIKRELELKTYFWIRIRQIEDIEMYCSKNHNKLSIFSFNVKRLDPYKIAELLSDKFKIQTRAGCSCAWPYWHDILSLEDEQNFDEKPGWLRVWIHYLHEESDIDYFLESLKKVISILSKKK